MKRLPKWANMGLLERLVTVAVLDGKLQRERVLLDSHVKAGCPALAGLSATIAVRTAFDHYAIKRARHIYVGEAP